MGEISPFAINEIRKEVCKMDLEKIVKEVVKEIVKEELFKKDDVVPVEQPIETITDSIM